MIARPIIGMMTHVAAAKATCAVDIRRLHDPTGIVFSPASNMSAINGVHCQISTATKRCQCGMLAVKQSA